MGFYPRRWLRLVPQRFLGMVAVFGWAVGFVSRIREYMDFLRAMGLAALPLRQLVFQSGLRLVLDAGWFRVVVTRAGNLVSRPRLDRLGAAIARNGRQYGWRFSRVETRP